MNGSGCRRYVGKIAVITGSAQGIGFACAQRLGREGAAVLVVDKAEGPAQEAVAALRREEIEAAAVAADLSVYSGAVAAMRAAHATFGHIDVLVNNVGGTIWKKPFWFYTEEEIQKEVERSFWPPLWCCRAAIPYMIERRQGCIVNIGSGATESIYRIPYSASKGGVVALTTSLAVELADFGIRVNCLSPGGTEIKDRKTQRTSRPLTSDEQQWEREFFDYVRAERLIESFANPDDQAAVVAFLGSDEAAYLTGEIIDTGRQGMSISKGTAPMPARSP